MIEQDLAEYHKTFTHELTAIKNRLRYLIGDAHLPSDGYYHEAILKSVIKKFLPSKFSVGHGFVMNSDRRFTHQIDIIIYDDSSSILFKEEDFVVIPAKCVKAIIEVKRWESMSSTDLKKIITKANENANIICSKHVGKSILNNEYDLFNGVFLFEENISLRTLETRLKGIYDNSPCTWEKRVNHICAGSKIFVKLFKEKRSDNSAHQIFKGYELEDLSFSYFISNLLSFLESDILRENDNLLFPHDKAQFNTFVVDATQDPL